MTETITTLQFRIRGRISRYFSPLFQDVDDARVGASPRTSFSSHRYTEEVKIFSRQM